MTRALGFIAAVAIATGTGGSVSSAQQSADPPTQTPFVEKVEVRVRSVLVFITDAKGKPLAAAPKASDLRATENGAPVEIIAVEPVARPTPAAANVAESTATPAPAELAAKAPSGIPQYLYFDTTALNQRSMPILVHAVGDNLDAFLSNGPLEIVGADPEPRVLLPSTRDAAKIKETLQRLPKDMPGKERLLWLRRDTMNDIQNAQDRRGGAAESVRAHIRHSVREEITLIQNSLERLEAWASARSDDRAGVLYYANDGFDVDPVEIYRNNVSRQDNETQREVFLLASEFGGAVSKLLARAEGTLAGKGLTTVPLALGGILAEMAGNAANLNVRGGAALRRPIDSAPVYFYERPMEPLRLVADATGGEVVSAANRLPAAVAHVGGAYLVTFRAKAASDGKAHPFAVTAVSGDLQIRAPKYLMTGSPESASIHRAMRALEGTDYARDVPITASLLASPVPDKDGRYSGALRIAANFAGAGDVFQEGTHLWLRLAMAVSVKNAPPFTTSEEVEWVPDSTSWRYQAPLTWPKGAEKIAIVVEEISTGLAGSAVVDIPNTP